MFILSAQGKERSPGHLSITAHGDDGLVHFTAYRKRGHRAVVVGEYDVPAAALKALANLGTGTFGCADCPAKFETKREADAHRKEKHETQGL